MKRYKFKKNEILFTSDEHYGHSNIIKFCNRPFSNVNEMDDILIKNHNKIANENTITVHIGDFSFHNVKIIIDIINQLEGKHLFISGCHDKILENQWNKIISECQQKLYTTRIPEPILNIKVDNISITCCHYAMRRWPASHYDTWHLFGHTHCRLESYGKCFDIGVDCNNYKPYTFQDVEQKMLNCDDNENSLKKGRKK